MTLAQAYAQALYNLAFSGRAKDAAALKGVLERKGHSALLPAIAKEFGRLKERGAARSGELELAHKIDAGALAEEIGSACEALGVERQGLMARENPSLVGGFIIRTRERQVDASHRKGLLDLYERLISA